MKERRRQARSKGAAARIEGPAAPSRTEEDSEGLDRLHGEKKSMYRYVVRGEEFDVNEQTYELLHTKYDTYRPKVRLYHTPKSKMLLSVEPI